MAFYFFERQKSGAIYKFNKVFCSAMFLGVVNAAVFELLQAGAVTNGDTVAAAVFAQSQLLLKPAWVFAVAGN